MRLPAGRWPVLGWLLGTLLLLSLLCADARADITVTLSPKVQQMIDGSPGESTKNIEAQINGALRALVGGKIKTPTPADTKALAQAAKRLLASKQTIRILCRSEAAKDPSLRAQYEQSDPGGRGGGAATRGDFDAKGNPKPKGTAVIVIECSRLWSFGWWGDSAPGAATSKFPWTVLGVITHELLHASQAKYRHQSKGPDEHLYGLFEKKLVGWMLDNHVNGPVNSGPFTFGPPASGTNFSEATDAAGNRTVRWSGRWDNVVVITPDGHATQTRTANDPKDGTPPPPEQFWIVPDPSGGRTEIRKTVTWIIDEGTAKTDGIETKKPKTTIIKTSYDRSGATIRREKTTITATDAGGTQREWKTETSESKSSRKATFTGTEQFNSGSPRFTSSISIKEEPDGSKVEERLWIDRKTGQPKRRRATTDPSGKRTWENWDPKTKTWVPLERKTKTAPKPKPDSGAMLPKPLGGGAFVLGSPGLLQLPLESSPQPRYRWSVAGGWLLRPGRSPFALGVGGTLEHGVGPRVSSGDLDIRSHEVRLQAQARPGVALLDDRLLISGIAGLGYLAHTTRVTGYMTERDTAHGLALGLGAGGLYAVWRNLVVGGSVGVDLQWLRLGGQNVGAHALDIEATAGWMF